MYAIQVISLSLKLYTLQLLSLVTYQAMGSWCHIFRGLVPKNLVAILQIDSILPYVCSVIGLRSQIMLRSCYKKKGALQRSRWILPTACSYIKPQLGLETVFFFLTSTHRIGLEKCPVQQSRTSRFSVILQKKVAGCP